jgi:hypothetical protein
MRGRDRSRGSDGYEMVKGDGDGSGEGCNVDTERGGVVTLCGGLEWAVDGWRERVVI